MTDLSHCAPTNLRLSHNAQSNVIHVPILRHCMHARMTYDLIDYLAYVHRTEA